MRRLSKYQRNPWMTEIRKKRKTNPGYRGEKHPLCRIPDEIVSFIRSGSRPAIEDAMSFGLTARYVYQLRAGERRNENKTR